ncbi:unnamed protein product [Aphanomyces euteiches]
MAASSPPSVTPSKQQTEEIDVHEERCASPPSSVKNAEIPASTAVDVSETVDAQAVRPIRSKRPRISSCQRNSEAKKKSLCFSSATTFVFPLDYGGSAIPETAGPPIGLAAHHVDSTTIDISSISRPPRSGVQRFSRLERVRMLKAAKSTGSDIACFCSEATDIRSSREETQEQWIRSHKDFRCAV